MKLLRHTLVAGSVALLVACGGDSSIGTPGTPGTSALSAVVTRLVGTESVTGSADGTGAAASFGSLGGGLAVDSSGNVYVADTSNYIIRKITPAGLVTTLAGTAGVSASTDGTGAAARFKNPVSVAVDPSGNVYVGDIDSSGALTRKITAAGVVTTLAGAYGRVVADSSGNLYFFKDNAIQKDTGGVVTTLAGTVGVSGSTDGTGATARFGTNGVMTIDSIGNIYVYDKATIRKITSAGVVTTLAGTADQFGTTDGTGAAARFHQAGGITVDSSGNVYVSEIYKATIRKITSAGVVTTLAGTADQFGTTDGTGAAARFFTPVGVAVDSSGNILVFDRSGGIRKITP